MKIESALIRQEQTKDEKAVFTLNNIAFNQENEAKLVDSLRKNEEAFIPELSLVAELSEEIIGHILFSKIKIKDENGNLHESISLAPMSVLPDFHKKGIGEKLLLKGLKTAKNLGHQSVIVLGHEHYYPKFGFQPAEKFDIYTSFEVPANVFMALELVENGLKNISGTVIYPKEFEEV